MIAVEKILFGITVGVLCLCVFLLVHSQLQQCFPLLMLLPLNKHLEVMTQLSCLVQCFNLLLLHSHSVAKNASPTSFWPLKPLTCSFFLLSTIARMFSFVDAFATLSEHLEP